jgi:ABC-2 type transport system permease protein
MMKATKLPEKPLHLESDALPIGTQGRTSALNSIIALFTMTVVRQARSRRLLVLALLYILPITLAVVYRQYTLGWRGHALGYSPSFAEFTLILNLIPQALVPLTALVYASGMIQDELEEQTITYLLIRPLPRWSIYVAKLLATLVVTIGLTAACTALTYAVIGWDQPDYWKDGATARMLKTIAIFAVTLTVYNSLFGVVSLLMKRALLLGVGYIILLEGVVSNIDFMVRKLTVMYYFRVLSERWMNVSTMSGIPGVELTYNIDFATAPSFGEALATLSIASAIVVGLACYVMSTREFRVKTPEGS